MIVFAPDARSLRPRLGFAQFTTRAARLNRAMAVHHACSGSAKELDAGVRHTGPPEGVRQSIENRVVLAQKPCRNSGPEGGKPVNYATAVMPITRCPSAAYGWLRKSNDIFIELGSGDRMGASAILRKLKVDVVQFEATSGR
jgi:hypothetical protein